MAAPTHEHPVEQQTRRVPSAPRRRRPAAGETLNQGQRAVGRGQPGDRIGAQRELVEALMGGCRVHGDELGRDRQRQVLGLGARQAEDVVERTRHQANSASPT